MKLPFTKASGGRTSRYLHRGESTIASIGLLLAAIILCAMGGSAWWSAKTQERTWRESRQRDVLAIGDLLREQTKTLLALDEVSAVRRLTAAAARTHDFTQCRVVLPEGQVIASAEASGITLASLPPQWPPVPMEEIPPAVTEESIGLTYPLTIPGRGGVRLEIVAPLEAPPAEAWDAHAGTGIIGAGALLALLMVYRRMRARMRALSYIREALLSIDAGETSLAALTIQRDLGPEATAWNDLLAERERLQQVLVTKRLLELPSSRQERSQDLASMCDAMSQGLILVDSSLCVTYANGAAGLYLGTRREEILGNAIDTSLKHEEVLESVRSVASGSIRRSTAVEIARSSDDGATGVLRFSVRPVRRDDESAAMIVIEDVTQQRVADDSRNTFVAQVTHELRTPLTNILLYADSAMEGGEEDAHARAHAISVINQEARRLARIVSDMLSVSELEAGARGLRIDDVDLRTVFENLRDDYVASAREKSIEFKVDLPPKLPVIQADRDKIELALHNLVGNAIKYTPEHGRVDVVVDAQEDEIMVKVIDNGLGMEECELERVFEKFYRAKDDRIANITGSGLGLALAREVVRLHGGDITVESRIDEGSTFTVTVPVTSGGRPAQGPARAPRSAAKRGPKETARGPRFVA